MSYLVTSRGIGDTLDWLHKFPDTTRKAARLALNTVTEREALPQFRKGILEDLHFPPAYLRRSDRLGITKKATENDLSTVISARDRATSLAQFVVGSSAVRKNGVILQVKRGRTVHLRRAFLINLKNGNRGLAVRLAEGERLQNKHGPAVQLAPNLYLLYGPSVDQAFRVLIPEQENRIGTALEREFLRQFTRLNRG